MSMRPLILCIALAGLAIIPALLQDPYWTDVLTFFQIFLIFATSLRIVISTGQISFAHPGLAAIGAYCSGALAVNFGLSFWVCLPAAILISALASLIIGYPTLRIKGVYFFLVTFMFTCLVAVIIGNFWIPTFGGWRGLLNIPRPGSITIPGLFVINFNNDLAYYYLALFLTVIVVLAIYRLEKTRFAWVFNAIETDDVLAESVGIHLMKYKLLAFVMAGSIAGLGGALFAHYQRIVTPYDFDMHMGILLFVYIVVGGMGTVVGPVMGVIALRILAQPLYQFREYETMILGIILILFLRFIPGGLVNLSEWTAKYLYPKGAPTKLASIEYSLKE
jgi:branched-chain amino acid transport system permease protein